MDEAEQARIFFELLLAPGTIGLLIDQLPDARAVALLKVAHQALRLRGAKLLAVPDGRPVAPPLTDQGGV